MSTQMNSNCSHHWIGLSCRRNEMSKNIHPQLQATVIMVNDFILLWKNK